jgi:hypothetical protein
MTIKKPYKRTCRQLLDGTYSNSGNWKYLIHEEFVQDPQHYIRAFLLIQKDLINLFDYIEPRDENLGTISFRIHELLIRTCIEIEANFTAILRENIYSKKDNLNMSDYKLINKSHRLSSYNVALPVWDGISKIRNPFQNWDEDKPLVWYQAYNKSKHDRHKNFNLATFDNLINAVSGLSVVLSAQFHVEDYSPNEKGRSIGPGYSYRGNDGFETGIGEYFRLLFPNDWKIDERYDFQWSELEKMDSPFDRFNYDIL